MLNSGDIDKSILEVFSSMKVGTKYKLNDKALKEINTIRNKNGYSTMAPFSFSKKDSTLEFEWKDSSHKPMVQVAGVESPALAFAFTLTFALSFAFSFAFAFAFSQNQIVEAEPDCDGKVVEIEGKRYKLVLQK